MPQTPKNKTPKITPLSDRPRSGPYAGLNARSAKRFLAGQFNEAGLPTPDIDARELVLAATGMSHAELITSGTEFLSQEVFETISNYAERRMAGEPVDHILGRRGFYGRDFKVTADVLSPRPDTEVLIDKALGFLGPYKRPKILDLGTGSGALAVTLLAEIQSAAGTATDISEAALGIARGNAAAHDVGARLAVIKSNWFENIAGQFDLIISNPPYIDGPAMATLPREVKDFDPDMALFGGDDGLAAYRIISAQAAKYLAQGGRLILEIGFDQGKAVPDILRSNGWTDITMAQDLAGQDRCVQAARA